MKTREELEQMFDERFRYISGVNNNNGYDDDENDVKQFIFETIIPEVLISIIPNKEFELIYGARDAFRMTKHKAKELYNITL